MDLIEPLEQEFEKRAKEQGLVRSNSLPENTAWPFLRIVFGKGKCDVVYSPPLPPPGRPLTPFYLEFARQVIAHSLKMPEKSNWKNCVVESDQEAETTDRIRKEYSFLTA